MNNVRLGTGGFFFVLVACFVFTHATYWFPSISKHPWESRALVKTSPSLNKVNLPQGGLEPQPIGSRVYEFALLATPFIISFKYACVHVRVCVCVNYSK